MLVSSLDIPWPRLSAPELLAQAVRQLRAAGSFVLDVAVTSDTSTSRVFDARSRISARAFLASEPYRDGAAPNVVALGSDNGLIQIGFSYLEQGYYFRLFLDQSRRIVRGRLISPNHEITRTFSYSRNFTPAPCRR
jgi:hypothetical protein